MDRANYSPFSAGVLFPTSSYDEIDARIRKARPRGVVTHPGLAERLPARAMRCVKHVFLTAGGKLDLFDSEVVMQGELPRTRSGMQLRSVLIARELGVPSGGPTRLSEQ